MPQQDPSKFDVLGGLSSSADLMSRGAGIAGDYVATADVLITVPDQVRGIGKAFGVGRRIVVPAEEIHIVTGGGMHSFFGISKETHVYGQAAKKLPLYWLNPLTSVVKLKTVSFIVRVVGDNSQGVNALDMDKVPFLVWAHVVAKLNPDVAMTAAQRIGNDIRGLVTTITEVTQSEIIAAASRMGLETIIADRQQLAKHAENEVNVTLAGLGYDLQLLRITELGGEAYEKLVTQAVAVVTKQTTIATNAELLLTRESVEEKLRREAVIVAETKRKTKSEELAADRDVQTAQLNQDEDLGLRRHTLALKKADRQRTANIAQQAVDLGKVQLDQEVALEQVQRDAEVAIKTQALAKQREQEQVVADAAIELARTQQESLRLAAEQQKKLERDFARTEEEAKRLQAEEEARANRDRDVLLIGAKADAEAIRIGAEAAAEKKRTEAQATAAAADFEATAKERDSAAQIKQATATRAKTAAEGLAQAEVAEAKAAAEIKQAEAAQATGFAQAAIAEKDAAVEAGRIRLVAEAELDAEARRAKLYAESPELLALERLDREHWQAIALAKQELDARVAMMVALAPHIQLDAKVIGNGSQMGQIMGQMMTLASGYNVMVNDPTVSSIVGSGGSAISVGGDILSRVLPAVRSAFAGVNPRVFASLTVADALDRLQGVVSGEQDVVTAIQKLRDDANFRMVGNIPVGQILGVFLGGGGEATQPAGDESLVLQ
ncbi:hypothetical protein COY32_00715 [candidate division WWE3 bacterium CG_4_10_14_0_2_um_filter_41_14]|uniref:Band 7 domain-containing protein n=1 Tax=candidate division WWE3 bacterium CG_4_10_14_0_2_um_filter_41_14 TaxID=1975072 RepID=A0A2M7TLN8_UNCKA|nr:MAG: hypothetical protein COY32_00715 [candidate division WWE3 bacterium CG_4_10_14_0_2_um_filter_41_14]